MGVWIQWCWKVILENEYTERWQDLKATIYDPKSMGPENVSILTAIFIPQNIILNVNLKNKIE